MSRFLAHRSKGEKCEFAETAKWRAKFTEAGICQCITNDRFAEVMSDPKAFRLRPIPDSFFEMTRSHTKLPSLDAFAAFEAEARQLNVTRAGEELNVTQDAVSKQILHLEAELGAFSCAAIRTTVRRS